MILQAVDTLSNGECHALANMDTTPRTFQLLRHPTKPHLNGVAPTSSECFLMWSARAFDVAKQDELADAPAGQHEPWPHA